MDFDSIEKMNDKEIDELYYNAQMITCFCCTDTYAFGDISPGNFCNASLQYYCSTLVGKYRCGFGVYFCGSAASGFGGDGIKCVR